MKIKTQDLTGAALDWAVAMSKGIPAEELYIPKWGSQLPPSIYRRCRDWDGNLDASYTSGPDLLFSRKWEAGRRGGCTQEVTVTTSSPPI